MQKGDKFVIRVTDDVTMECEYVAHHHYPQGIRHDYKILRSVAYGRVTEGITTVQSADLSLWAIEDVQLA